MPKYIYTAKSYSGQSKGGEMTAQNEKMLAQQLRTEGFLVTSIKEIEEKKNGIKIKFLDRFKSVPLKEKMIFARNLSVMISSGVTISRAMNNLSLQTKNQTFKKVLSDLYNDLQGGKSLSEGLAKYPNVFSELFINMTRVGEAGGNLEESLDIIATQLEKDHELISKVRGAMIYPAVIVAAMFGIGILMFTYILPKITSVFSDMDVELPPATRFVMGISAFFKNNSILVIAGFIILAVLTKILLQTQFGKKLISFLAIKFPVTRDIVVKVNCARFARIYSSLLKSGVSAIDALKIISHTLSNYYFKKAIEEGVSQIQKGTNLSKIIGNYPNVFPLLVSQMIEVGEETGKTENVLLRLAEFYEEEVNQITKNLSSVIEPVLMVVIGGAVGFFAVAMLQPMYSLMENIK